ncbi:MAG: class II glutamine amidotransferase, partial [Clostridia bacterium]
MCGIFGYIGKSNAAEIIIQGLKNLEYRGYDSAGMAVTNNKQIFHIKQIGKVEDLENIYQHLPKEKKLKYISHCGIGHTRWATHGKVTLENCHPHLSFDNAIAIVHNGTIENYIELKKFILCNGINVTGDTDSEIIAHLIALNYKNSLYNAVVKTITLLKGSFAFAVISKYNPNTIIVAKHNSPLVIGCNKEGFYISSDIPALNSICSEIYIMAENEIAKITNKKLMFYLNNKIIVKNPINVTAEKQENSYNGFSCFMDKEINDIPNAIINTYNDINNKKDLLYKISLSIEKSSRIIFVGCGTAFHAALASSYI